MAVQLHVHNYDPYGALDQGTTSTRFMVFDAGGSEVARHQLEHEQIMPQPGWVEHDPLEIAERTNTVIAGALRHAEPRRRAISPPSASPTSARPPSCGIRRPGGPGTTPSSGRTRAPIASSAPLDRASAGKVIRERTGLPPATYFSGAKLQWILENVDGVRAAAEARRGGLRHDRQLGDLEPHRRRRRRRRTSPTSPTPAARC